MTSKNLSLGNKELPLQPGADRHEGGQKKVQKKAPSCISMRRLISQNVRSSLWLVLLGLLVMLFNYPVNLAMQLSSVQQEFEQQGYTVSTELYEGSSFEMAAGAASVQNGVIGGADGPTSIFIAGKSTALTERMSDTANQVLLGNYTLIAFIIIVAAALCAFAMFRYLYQKQQVDFYHSLPVSRTRRFFAHYLSGALIMAGTWAVGLLGALLVAAVFRVPDLMLSQTVMVNAAYFLLFLFIYTVTIGALLLSGNLAVGVLSTAWVWSVGPSAAGIIYALKSLYFTTLYDAGGMEQKLRYLSPIKYLLEYMTYPRVLADAAASPQPFVEAEKLAALQPHTEKMLLTAAFLTAAGIVLTLWLYRRRASETAGSSVAFAAVKAPVRIITTVLSALLLSMMGGELGFAWTVFFTVAAAVVVHAVLETIMQLDIRKLFSHRGELIFTVALSLLIIGIFQFDVFGYNRFVPEKAQIESAAVYVSGLSDGAETGSIIRAQEAYGSVADGTFNDGKRDSQNYRYASPATAQSLMFLQSDEEISAVRELGLMGASMLRTGDWNRRYHYENGDIYVRILYRLKNGKTDERTYYLQMKEAETVLQTIFSSGAYKKAVYPILDVKAEDVGVFGTVLSDKSRKKFAETGQNLPRLPLSDIVLSDGTIRSALDLSGVSEDMNKELLEALQKDIEAMQLSDYLSWQDKTDVKQDRKQDDGQAGEQSEMQDSGQDGGTVLEQGTEETGDVTAIEKSTEEMADEMYSYLVYVPLEEELAAKQRAAQGSPDIDGEYVYYDMYPIYEGFTHVRAVLAAHGIEV